MYKRILSIIVTVCIVLSLMACSEAKGDVEKFNGQYRFSNGRLELVYTFDGKGHGVSTLYFSNGENSEDKFNYIVENDIIKIKYKKGMQEIKEIRYRFDNGDLILINDDGTEMVYKGSANSGENSNKSKNNKVLTSKKEIRDAIIGTFGNSMDTYTFNEDGTVIYKSLLGSTIEGTWYISGNKLYTKIGPASLKTKDKIYAILDNFTGEGLQFLCESSGGSVRHSGDVVYKK